MTPDLAQRLSREHYYYWSSDLSDLSDGWVQSLVDFWWQLLAIKQPGPTDSSLTWVSLKYQINPAALTAYATPVSIKQFAGEQALAVFTAIDKLQKRVQRTCEECGRPGYRHKTTLGIGGGDRILCDTCGQSWRDGIEAAMDAAAAAETWSKVQSRFPDYFKPALNSIPGIYADDVERLFAEVTRISGGQTLIEIDILFDGTDISASMRPVVSTDEITDDQKASLFILMKAFGKGDSDASS